MPDLSWDLYFYNICVAVASKSRCLSRQIGAIIVYDNSVVATGYNGPPRGVSHCGPECPRKLAGFPSGEGLHLCPAAHAEANCIVNAARLGVSVVGSTIYMNCPIPCTECSKLIINAGISEVVVVDASFYSTNWELMTRLYTNGPKVRQFAFVHLMDKDPEDKDVKR